MKKYKVTWKGYEWIVKMPDRDGYDLTVAVINAIPYSILEEIVNYGDVYDVLKYVDVEEVSENEA